MDINFAINDLYLQSVSECMLFFAIYFCIAFFLCFTIFLGLQVLSGLIEVHNAAAPTRWVSGSRLVSSMCPVMSWPSSQWCRTQWLVVSWLGLCYGVDVLVVGFPICSYINFWHLVLTYSLSKNLMLVQTLEKAGILVWSLLKRISSLVLHSKLIIYLSKHAQILRTLHNVLYVFVVHSCMFEMLNIYWT